MKKHWVDILHSSGVAWVILTISLIITMIAWFLSNDYANEKALEHFKFEVAEAHSAIEKRFTIYEQVLRSGLGLFQASGGVDREMWQKFITSLNVDKYYPGTLGIGYSVWLQPEQLQAHIDKVRAEGFADFTVRPEGSRAVYSSIIYLEPFNARNKRAFGFDMYSEPTRREAMSRARDTGETALSGKVTLVQETSSDIQAGFLIYVPHYSQEVSTVEERREHLLGFVYSALRIGDLMNGILSKQTPEIDFEIYDGEAMSVDTLLYDSNNQLLLADINNNHQFGITQKLNVGGHVWTIYYNSNDAFDIATKTQQPTLVAVGGIIIDILLFNVILSLSRLRKRAIALADKRMSELAEKEMQFKSISDTAYDGIVTLNEDGTISYANKSASTIFNMPVSELVGSKFLSLFPESSHAEVSNILDAQKLPSIDSEKTSKPREIHAIRSNQETFPLELIVGHWKQGATLNLTAAFRDITERHRVDILKNEFISTVSHELRTPLTSILGALGLVKSGTLGPLNNKINELIDIAHNNSDRLIRLVNDILDIEKMAQGKMKFQLQKYDTTALIDNALHDIEAIAEKHAITLNITKTCRAYIIVDKDRFTQVITNLLSNAIKFSPPKSRIDIQTSIHADRVRISVTDYGPGIPEKFQDQIFSRFSQADSSDTRRFGGSGLGLNIAKDMVEKMGGSISFASDPGNETTFTVSFPVCATSEIAQTEVPAVNTASA